MLEPAILDAGTGENFCSNRRRRSFFCWNRIFILLGPARIFAAIRRRRAVVLGTGRFFCWNHDILLDSVQFICYAEAEPCFLFFATNVPFFAGTTHGFCCNQTAPCWNRRQRQPPTETAAVLLLQPARTTATSGNDGGHFFAATSNCGSYHRRPTQRRAARTFLRMATRKTVPAAGRAVDLRRGWRSQRRQNS